MHDFFEAEHERRKQEAERDQEWKLWIAYVMANVSGYYSGTFEEYMKSVMKPESTTRRRGNDASMTEKDVQSIMDRLFKQE